MKEEVVFRNFRLFMRTYLSMNRFSAESKEEKRKALKEMARIFQDSCELCYQEHHTIKEWLIFVNERRKENEFHQRTRG